VELSDRSVRVEIDALVFDGLEPRDRGAVVHAAELELGRLLGERGVPPLLAESGEHRMLRGPSVGIAHDGAALGAEVARAVYGALGQ
jgi:hypothetical protein